MNHNDCYKASLLLYYKQVSEYGTNGKVCWCKLHHFQLTTVGPLSKYWTSRSLKAHRHGDGEHLHLNSNCFRRSLDRNQ